MDVNQADCTFPRNEFNPLGRMITLVTTSLSCCVFTPRISFRSYFTSFFQRHSQHFLLYQRLYTYISHRLYFVKYPHIGKFLPEFLSKFLCALLLFNTQESSYLCLPKFQTPFHLVLFSHSFNLSAANIDFHSLLLSHLSFPQRRSYIFRFLQDLRLIQLFYSQ